MRKRRYRIAELLGRGAFGSVYRAEKLGEEGFSTVVALKLLHELAAGSGSEQQRNEAVRRLRDEARLLGLLKHRAIVQVYDLERLRGEWAVVMEYVDGMHLGEVAELTRVPVRQALAIVEEVADGLHHACNTRIQGRELGLLHRDIKPSNVMITAGGSVKVLDFGIARANFEDRESRTAGFLVGTERYMSPEHLDFEDGGGQVGPGSDVYALGAVLFEILCGRPLGRASLDPIHHRDRVARQLDEHILGRVPRGLFDLIKRTLAFQVAERPTALELREACERLQQEVPGESLRAWCERVVGPMIRERRERHQPAADPLVGSVLEEGDLPGQAQLHAHDATVGGGPRPAPVAPPRPAASAPAPAAAQRPQAPADTARPSARRPEAVRSPGAIGIDAQDDAQVAALGANLATFDESTDAVTGRGLDITFDGDERAGERPVRRRGEPAAGSPRRALLFLAAGAGAVVVVALGLAALWALLGDREPVTAVTEAPPTAVGDAAPPPEPTAAPEAPPAAERPAPVEPRAAQRPAPAPVVAPAAEAARSRPEPAPSPAPEPTPADLAAARAKAIAALSGAAPAGAPAAPAEPSGAVVTVTEAPPAPEPLAEPPPPPAPGSYKVVGNALEAFLKQGGRRFDPGSSLEPGRYDIWARFDRTVGAAAIRVGVVQIPAGTTVTLSCDAELTLCRAL